jgi:hypothetical protein
VNWLKNLLKKAGVDEFTIDRLAADVAKVLPKHFVPKARYNDLAVTKRKLERDIADRDRRLEELARSVSLGEALKTQLAQLQAAYASAQEKHAAELKDLRLQTAIKLALAGKVHDPDLVAGLLDQSRIELDDAGRIIAGFDEQIEALRESKAFLFVRESPAGHGFSLRGVKPAACCCCGCFGGNGGHGRNGC